MAKSLSRQSKLLRDRQNALVLQETGIDLAVAEEEFSRRRSPIRPSPEVLDAANQELIAGRGTSVAVPGAVPVPSVPRRRVGETPEKFEERIRTRNGVGRFAAAQAVEESQEIGRDDVISAIKAENQRRAKRGQPALNQTAQRSFINRTLAPSVGFDFDSVQDDLFANDIADLSNSTDGKIRKDFDDLRSQMVAVAGDDSLTDVEKEEVLDALQERMGRLARQAKLFERQSQSSHSHPVTGQPLGVPFVDETTGATGVYDQNGVFKPFKPSDLGLPTLKEFSDLWSVAKESLTTISTDAEGTQSIAEPSQDAVMARVQEMMALYRQMMQQQATSAPQTSGQSPAGTAFFDGAAIGATVGQEIGRAKQEAAAAIPIARTKDEAQQLRSLMLAGEIDAFTAVRPDGSEMTFTVNEKGELINAER